MLALRNYFGVRRPCARRTVIGEDVISGAMADERPVWHAKMVRMRIPRILRNNTGIAEDGSDVAQEEEINCSQ